VKRRHARARRGHPRFDVRKSWMAGSSPAMTAELLANHRDIDGPQSPPRGLDVEAHRLAFVKQRDFVRQVGAVHEPVARARELIVCCTAPRARIFDALKFLWKILSLQSVDYLVRPNVQAHSRPIVIVFVDSHRDFNLPSWKVFD
jgi:hypothetical protein